MGSLFKTMQKYPKIYEVIKACRNTQAKCTCGEIAKNKTAISVNYMRGDDEVFWTCDTHKKDIEFIMKG